MGNKGLILYCVSNTDMDEKINMLSLDETNRIYSIKHKDIYGIVSDIDLDEYGEENIQSRSEDVRWLSSMAARFMDILLEIGSKSTIIPMKFFTLFNNADRVHEIMEDNYINFTSSLKNLGDKEEWSVKVYCNTRYFKEHCMGEEIEEFERSISSKPKGTAFFLRKKFESQLDDKVQNKVFNISNGVIEEIKKYSLKTKANKLLAKELSGRIEQMILNCSFLIERSLKPEFMRSLEELEKSCISQGFIIDYSGPWPPYNFC